MHVISCFNERVVLKIKGKACYSLCLNKQNLLGGWLLGSQGQNQHASAHVVPVTLSHQPRTEEEINSHISVSAENQNIHIILGSLILSHTENT